MKCFANGLHFGAIGTAALIQKAATWPGLIQDVEEFVANCSICQQARHQQEPQQPFQAFADPGQVRHSQCANLAGPFPTSNLGNCHLLIIINVTSHYLFAFPLKSAASKKNYSISFESIQTSWESCNPGHGQWAGTPVSADAGVLQAPWSQPPPHHINQHQMAWLNGQLEPSRSSSTPSLSSFQTSAELGLPCPPSAGSI